MFSVILPTMWKCPEVTLPEIRKLHDHPMVGEFILINNDKKATPAEFKREEFDKLYYIEPPSNIFVNPAWNIGTEVSTKEHCILLSDDISVISYDPLLEKVSKHLSQIDSLIGIDPSCYKNQKTNDPKINPIDIRGLGFGCLMFLHTKSYKKIPEQLKVWCGDDFLIAYFKKYKEGIQSISMIDIHTKIATTSDLPEFNFKYAESDYFNIHKERMVDS